MNGLARLDPTSGRTRGDLEIDLAIALRVEGYRWVEWSLRGLRDQPLYEPGRFIGHPGDMTSQHYVAAAPDAPLAREPYRHLPHYSGDAGLALRAGERAGLFRDPGVRVMAATNGSWTLEAAAASTRLGDSSLPRLICRATLALLDQVPAREES